MTVWNIETSRQWRWVHSLVRRWPSLPIRCSNKLPDQDMKIDPQRWIETLRHVKTLGDSRRTLADPLLHYLSLSLCSEDPESFKKVIQRWRGQNKLQALAFSWTVPGCANLQSRRSYVLPSVSPNTQWESAPKSTNREPWQATCVIQAGKWGGRTLRNP